MYQFFKKMYQFFYQIDYYLTYKKITIFKKLNMLINNLILFINDYQFYSWVPPIIYFIVDVVKVYFMAILQDII